MTKSIFLPVIILFVLVFSLLQLSNTPVNAQNTPVKAYFNITNNSDVDLQYYACNGTAELSLSDESEEGVNAGRYNQQGEYLQTNLEKNKTTSLSLSQGNDSQGNPIAFPANITIKVAAALPGVAGSIANICSSTNTTYIKSVTVPVNTATPVAISITGSGNTVTPKKGFVNSTFVSFGFDFSQELNQPLQQTTSQQPKIKFSSAGAQSGASVCVDNVVTPVTLNSSNVFELSLPPNTSPSISSIDSPTTCASTPSPLVLNNIQSNTEYTTTVNAFAAPIIYQSSSYTLTNTAYVPYQKGVYINSAAPDPNGQQSLYTQLAAVCVDNVVQNVVSPGTGYVTVSNGPKTFLPVNSSNACDTIARPMTLNTPANTLSSLMLVNVHNQDTPLNITLSGPAAAPVQEPTIQAPVSSPLPLNGAINSINNSITATMLLEQNLSGNLNFGDATAASSNQDLLALDLEFTGTTTLPANTTVTYTPITSPSDLTDGGAGLPQSATQLSIPFEITLNPKPANTLNMKVTILQPALKKQISQLNSANIKAYASNSPFAPFSATVNANAASITSQIPGGFKQFALYEVSSTNSLIRTGGEYLNRYWYALPVSLALITLVAMYGVNNRKNFLP
jgi:hypothetical protein